MRVCRSSCSQAMLATSRCPAAFQASAGQGRNNISGKHGSQRQQRVTSHAPGLAIKLDIIL